MSSRFASRHGYGYGLSRAFYMTLLAAALLPAAVGGCTQIRNYEMGTPLAASDRPNPADNLELAAVLRRLGPPLRVSAVPGGFVCAWEYWRVTVVNVGLDLGYIGLDSVSADIGRSGSSGDLLLLGFDSERRLTSSHFTEWEESAGGGQGIQVFTGIDVVDIEDLTGPLPAHHWGFGSLERLPISLNRRSRLDQGQSGIERRGTPRGAGQASLENP